MSKHTPGPWRFNEYSDSNLPAGVKEEVERHGLQIPRIRLLTNDGQAPITSDHAYKAIAYVQCQASFKRGEGHKSECSIRDANARLIAAAPETAAERDRLKEVNAELLAALKAMLNVRGCGTALDCSVCNSARAAIAKAEGKS
jgi:hypothetical protein